MKRNKTSDLSVDVNFTSGKYRKKLTTGQCDLEPNLNIVSKKVILFISQLSPDTESKDIKTFLDIKKRANYSIEKLTSKYPNKYASFKVGSPTDLYKDIYCPEFWSVNTYVSRYINKKRIGYPNLNVKTCHR